MFEDVPANGGDGNSKLGEPVDEVGSAVQRVDYPGVFTTLAAAAFFRQNSVTGVGPAQYLEDDLLGLGVGLGDIIVSTLRGYSQAVEPVLVH